MSEHRVAFTILTNEGFRQFEGGVARYVHNILDAREQAEAVARRHGVSVEWHVAERGARTGTDAASLQRALDRYVHNGSVQYHSLLDPRHGSDTDHFEHSVATGAQAGQLTLALARDADSVLVIGGMTMFAMAPRFVVRAAEQYGVRATFVHMTHEPVRRPKNDAGLPYAYADTVAGHLARVDDRVCVGWESGWMREQYQQVYGLPDEKLLFARAGVPLDDPKFAPQKPDEIEAALRNAGVPLDRDLVVSWGRGDAYKGFDLFLDAAKADGDRLVPVVLNPRPNPGLAEHARRIGSPAVLLSGMSDRFVSAVCQWPRTVTAAFLSNAEAAAVAPVEAALMGGRRGLIVTTVPTGVYPELNRHLETGVVAADRTVAGVAEALRAAHGLSPARRVEMGTAAWENARKNHDFKVNWLRSFEEMLTRHLAVVGGLPGPDPGITARPASASVPRTREQAEDERLRT
ncbi:hypothetical protein ACGFNV_39630 [Streptomyces sp. NPDC048751]|uniref:hypothetical protein n=1 Tax=Streptomyces sp. NPDC048751 TaxID=3365591 RepID=UPI00371849AF